MKPVHFLSALLLTLLLCTCGETNTDPDGAGVDTVEMDDTEQPNQDNTSIYDVDPDDPYLVSNGYFLGFKPGEPIAEYVDGLRKGRLRTGEGDFDVFFIDGAEGNELGFLTADPANEQNIGNITITSPAVVTEEGIRIGLSYEELVERIGAITFHGSEVESRVIGNKHGLSYRLEMESNKYDLDNSTIKPATKVTQIVIDRRPKR